MPVQKDKNTAIGDKLLEGTWAIPTRTQNVDEPDTSRPPPAPTEVIVRQPKTDPWDLVKEKFKVDLAYELRLDVPTNPSQEASRESRATKYLLFDHYFDCLCDDKFKELGLPLLDGQEQAMYYWFYRFSYGFGYKACPMSDATLMKKLNWVRKHVKRVLKSILEKKIIEELAEFPMHQHRRPQVYLVHLPRHIVNSKIEELRHKRGEIPPEIRVWIRQFTRDIPEDTSSLNSAADA